MNRFIAVLSLRALAGCSTANVQSTCESAERVLQIAAPFLSAAPASVQAAATVLGAGTYACTTSEYAAARDVVVAWLAQRGIKTH